MVESFCWRIQRFLLDSMMSSFVGELKEGQAAAKGGCPLQAKAVPLTKSGATTMELEPSIQSHLGCIGKKPARMQAKHIIGIIVTYTLCSNSKSSVPLTFIQDQVPVWKFQSTRTCNGKSAL